MAALEHCPEDFYALPPALRRKLFSNVERLRLEQMRLAQAHHENEHPYHTPLAPHSASTGTPPTFETISPRARPSTSRTACSSRTVRRRFQRRSRQGVLLPRIIRKPESLQTAYLVAQANSEWFQSLPRKVQQTHFSSEERALFAAGKRSSVILDAADKALYKLGHQSRLSLDSISTVPSITTASSATMASETRPEDSAIDMNESMYDTFRWLDEDDDLDLSLDYHSHIATQSSTPIPVNRLRPSFRRTFSINSLQRGRSSTASKIVPPTTQPSDLSTACSTPRRRSVSRPLPRVRHIPQTSVSSLEENAQYYQDPEARLKLRVFLASPQKFDEALEFGFPSLELKEDVNPRLSIDKEWKFHASETSFLEDDSKSSSDDMPPCSETLKNETTYLATSQTPSTRTLVNDAEPTRSSHQLPRERKPRPILPISHTKSQSLIGNREMTLKMTLTRPDLRTADAAGSTPSSEREDPFRLAALPAADQNLTIWDTLPEDQSVVKKMWRKMRGRK